MVMADGSREFHWLDICPPLFISNCQIAIFKIYFMASVFSEHPNYSFVFIFALVEVGRYFLALLLSKFNSISIKNHDELCK